MGAIISNVVAAGMIKDKRSSHVISRSNAHPGPRTPPHETQLVTQ